IDVEKRRSVDDDPSSRAPKAGNRLDQRRLPRSGSANERRYVRTQPTADGERERRERQTNVDLDHAANRLRCCAMRPPLIATSTQAIATTYATSIAASASLPFWTRS